MKNKQKYSWHIFLKRYAIYTVIVWLLYSAFMMRSLPGRTLNQSMWGLETMLILFGVVGTGVLFRNERTRAANVACVFLPYGVYTVLAYRNMIRRIYYLPLLLAISIGMVCSGIVLCRKLPRTKCPQKIWRKRWERCIWLMSMFASVGLACTLGAYFGNSFGKALLIDSEVTPLVGNHAAAENQTMEAQKDTLMLLQQETWEQLSIQKKVDVLQTVANIEAHTLGLPNELNVGADELTIGTLGGYEDSKHRLCISLEHLETSPVENVLKTICHEAYHSYQSRIAEIYQELPEQQRTLMLYRDAAVYAAEMDDYQNGATDFENYYNQQMEADARKYAEITVEKYDDYVGGILVKQEASVENGAESGAKD